MIPIVVNLVILLKQWKQGLTLQSLHQTLLYITTFMCNDITLVQKIQGP